MTAPLRQIEVCRAEVVTPLTIMVQAVMREQIVRAGRQAVIPCRRRGVVNHHRSRVVVIAHPQVAEQVREVVAATFPVAAVEAGEPLLEVAGALVAAAVVVDVDKENMMTNINTANRTSVLTQLSRAPSVLRGLALAMLVSIPLLGIAAEQKTFASSDEAVSALIDAFKADDDAALVSIFGEQHKRLVISPDKAANSASRAKISAALQAFHMLEQSGPDRFTIVLGEAAWPSPIPLVRENGAWRFATELGEDEIINRRIGSNEREAILVLRAYLDAQREYASKDRNGDDVREYAQKVGSSTGKQDGLYWPADQAKGEEASPFGPLIAASEDYLKGHKAGDSFRGYKFRILTQQGKSAPGGAFSYVINGRMIAGFAMVAYPAEYGLSGVMTFVVSNGGKIYQKNIAKDAAQIKSFNPDASWTKVDDPS